MTDAVATQRRRDARQILDAAIQAADPAGCVQRSLQLTSDALIVEGDPLPLTPASRIRVVGAGKATPAMAAATEALLGNRLEGGAINTKYGHSIPLQRIHTTECGHPIPDEAGVEGARRIMAELEGLQQEDLVICLLSGGGSALLPAPAGGLSLADKQDTTARLLECGASIDEVNTIRKHLSSLKGGQMARHAGPARLVTLAISDVIGDVPDTIASGPTVADPTTFSDCLRLLDHYDLRQRVPPSVLRHLEAGVAGDLADTPSDLDGLDLDGLGLDGLGSTRFHVIGNNGLSLAAARQTASSLGYTPLVLSSTIAGETRDVAGVHVAMGEEIVRSSQPVPAPACLISGGETTVTLAPDAGKGGRNQEFVLAAALALQSQPDITVLSAGTDGTDGPTDAAGAIADAQTLERAGRAGLDAALHLATNDAYPFFAALDDLIITGPTGTNVMDLRLVLIR